MCLICVHLEKDKLTALEARNNLKEAYTSLPKKHIHEILQLIWQKEDEEYAIWFANEKYGDSD